MTNRTNVSVMESTHRPNDDGIPHLSVTEAAAYLGVSNRTLYRWEDKGALNPVRTPGGQRRYSKDELDAVLTRKSA